MPEKLNAEANYAQTHYVLNFGRPSATPPLGWLCLALAVVLMVAVLAWAGYAQHQAQKAQHQYAALEQKMAANKLAAAPANPALQQAWLAALQQLNLPWQGLFSALETAQTPELVLLAIEPDASSGLVRITGLANDFAAVQAYLQRLSEQPALSQVLLQNYKNTGISAGATPGGGLRFTAQARWQAL